MSRRTEFDWGVHETAGGWLGNFATIFGAVFLAVMLAGLSLGLCLRAYLQWSVADSVQKFNEGVKAK